MRYLLSWFALVLIVYALIFVADDGFKVWDLASSGITVDAKIINVNPIPENSRSYSEFTYSWNGVVHSGRIGGAKGHTVGELIRITISKTDSALYIPGDANKEIRDILLWGVVQSIFVSTLIILAWWLRQYVWFLRRWP